MKKILLFLPIFFWGCYHAEYDITPKEDLSFDMTFTLTSESPEIIKSLSSSDTDCSLKDPKSLFCDKKGVSSGENTELAISYTQDSAGIFSFVIPNDAYQDESEKDTSSNDPLSQGISSSLKNQMPTARFTIRPFGTITETNCEKKENNTVLCDSLTNQKEYFVKWSKQGDFSLAKKTPSYYQNTLTRDKIKKKMPRMVQTTLKKAKNPPKKKLPDTPANKIKPVRASDLNPKILKKKP